MASNKIHVANNSSDPIAVVVAPDQFYRMTKMMESLASLANSMAFGSQLSTAFKAAKTIKDLQNIQLSNPYDRTFWDVISQGISPIKTGEFACVNSYNYLNLGNISSITHLPTMMGLPAYDLLVVSRAGRSSIFKSGSDESWLVESNAIYRSKYGELWTKASGVSSKDWRNNR